MVPETRAGRYRKTNIRSRALTTARFRGFYPCLIAVFITVPFMCTAFPVSPKDYPSSVSYFPENYEARMSLKDSVFADLDDGEAIRSRHVAQRKEKTEVLYKVEKTPEDLVYLFLNKAGNEFRMETAGNVSLRRDRNSGALLSMTVLLREDPLCYAKLHALDEKSVLSVYLFGTLVYRDLVIPEKLGKLAFEPFRSVIAATSDLLDWDGILGRRAADDYRKIVFMLGEIRKKLPLLDDVDDGVMDANGRFTFIATGEPQTGTHGFNCSGFAKWVMDGFYFPLTGRYMDVARLAKKELAYRGTSWTARYEDERDPFFGLDWTRNLAVTLEEARTTRPPAHPEVFDVRSVDYVGYREDIGYRVDQLELILFLLSREYPGSFYLGSINGDFGKNPVLRQHFHVVVLLPYVDEGGMFRVGVVERNEETSIGSLEKRFGGTFVHLVRIDSRGEFRLKAPE